jgi:hypothetical protein
MKDTDLLARVRFLEMATRSRWMGLVEFNYYIQMREVALQKGLIAEPEFKVIEESVGDGKVYADLSDDRMDSWPTPPKVVKHRTDQFWDAVNGVDD